MMYNLSLRLSSTRVYCPQTISAGGATSKRIKCFQVLVGLKAKFCNFTILHHDRCRMQLQTRSRQEADLSFSTLAPRCSIVGRSYRLLRGGTWRNLSLNPNKRCAYTGTRAISDLTSSWAGVLGFCHTIVGQEMRHHL